MRFIDLEQLYVDVKPFLDSLKMAQDEVTAEADPDKRAEIIGKHQPKWTALREIFERTSFDKCWYTECKNPGADNDIDHFRPKLGVREDDQHPGYYWLAFDWKNMRLSCQRANRPRRDPHSKEVGGKSDHFPLLSGGVRANAPGDNLAAEHPALLDPTNPADAAILSFKPNGEIDLSPEFKGKAVAEAKFEASRLNLHLNWPKFRDGRVMLYNRIERTVGRGQREAPRDFEGYPAASEAFIDAIRDLTTSMRPQEEYSAAARVYLESFKHLWWVKDIVLRVPA
jgi:uncharacterized protein (TIGR02646 family)